MHTARIDDEICKILHAIFVCRDPDAHFANADETGAEEIISN